MILESHISGEAMNPVHHFQWTSSVRCPDHNQAVEVSIDQSLAHGGSHVEITGCCGQFTGLVERSLRSVVKADFHTSIRTDGHRVVPAGDTVTAWVSGLRGKSE